MSEPRAPVREGRSPRNKRELLATVSPTRLAAWLSCRRRFYLKYCSGIYKPSSASLRIGVVVHAVLQEWNLARWRRQPFAEAELRATIEAAWLSAEADEPLDWKGDEAKNKRQTLHLLHAYLAHSPIPKSESVEAVEVSIDATLPGLPRIVGVIDLIRDGSVLVDFKTTARSPIPEMVRHTTAVQTIAYALLYRCASGRREQRREIHHLIRKASPGIMVTEQPPATDEEIGWLLKLINSYASGIEREDFVASPGWHCGACEYFAECRLGQH